MSTKTATNETRNELLEYMLDDACSSIGYWAESLDYDDEKVVVVDKIEGTTHTFSRAKFLTAVRNWANDHRNSGYDYFVRASRDILAGRWEDLDYDGEIADQAVQIAAFGKTIYS